ETKTEKMKHTEANMSNFTFLLVNKQYGCTLRSFWLAFDHPVFGGCAAQAAAGIGVRLWGRRVCGSPPVGHVEFKYRMGGQWRTDHAWIDFPIHHPYE